ncbi:Uma2 family endonuclease [Kyrpidia spormannii]|uniref:Endonuclease, Uma2 family (Restriction endonuclease fold) n=2 Tax=Kyrpidia spormannii TaxID=2055160 RepID=A0ACA8ZAC2_9BACL
MSKPGLHDQVPYTYADYVQWEESERWELLDGVPFMMASPTPEHQEILLRLASAFHTHLSGSRCTPHVGPLDLTFEEDDQTRTVVQPDLFVMCGTYGRSQRIVGIPVLVIEILSPSTASIDFVRKMNIYQRVGVEEYWIVDPALKLKFDSWGPLMGW